MAQSPENIDVSNLSIEDDIETQANGQPDLDAVDKACADVTTSRNPKLSRANNIVREYLRNKVAEFGNLDDLRAKVAFSLALVAPMNI